MSRKIPAFVAAFSLAVATTPALSQGYDDSGAGASTFVMPSHNVECVYTPAGGTDTYTPEDGGPELQCDRAEPSYVRVILGKHGRAQRIDNPGEQPCCSSDPVLQYGDTWSQGPFTCISADTGLTCTRNDGHGFFVSKAKIKVH